MKEKNLNYFINKSNTSVYVIAEIGVNHEGDIERAKRLIELAAEGGANAVKFQTYKAEKLASKNSPAYWDTTQEPTLSQYELFKKYDSFNLSDYRVLHDFCKKIGIDFMSTPFDHDSVDIIDDLIDIYKIASADINNFPLIRKIASKSKPVILSTGASSIFEIDQAIRILKNAGIESIGILHCVLNYPTEFKNAGLGAITYLAKIFPDLIIGYSDHTFPESDMLTLTTSVTLGAKIIEKHFTDDKSLQGNDHYHAMDVNDLKVFTKNLTRLRNIITLPDFNSRISEASAIKNARRSIVAKVNIPAGKIIEESDLTYKRPGSGISTTFWDKLIGMSVRVDVAEDEVIQWEYIA
jgi:sialic acid synthase SpsE